MVPDSLRCSYRLTGPNQAAAKTVRGQSLPTSAPSSLERAWGLAPRPFRRSASAPLPISPPFFLAANGKRRRWPIQNLFSPARSLAALPHSKKVLDGHPSPFAKTIPSMRKKGGRKTGALPAAWLSLHTATQGMPPLISFSEHNQKKGSRPLHGLPAQFS